MWERHYHCVSCCTEVYYWHWTSQLSSYLINLLICSHCSVRLPVYFLLWETWSKISMYDHRSVHSFLFLSFSSHWGKLNQTKGLSCTLLTQPPRGNDVKLKEPGSLCEFKMIMKGSIRTWLFFVSACFLFLLMHNWHLPVCDFELCFCSWIFM